MRLIYSTIALLLMMTWHGVRTDNVDSARRISRQTSNADQMVQNILQWLQGVYMQNTRKIRQGTVREYLPPSNTQRPRPFEPQTPANLEPADTNEVSGGYAPAGITPQPPFPSPSSNGNGHTSYPSPQPDITPPVEGPNFNGYPTQPKPQPPFQPGSTTSIPTTYPRPTGYPSGTTGYPSTGYPTPGYTTRYPTPGQTTGYPTYRPTPEQSTSGYTTQRPFPTGRPPFTSGPNEGPTNPPITSYPNSPTTTESITSPPVSQTPSPDDNNVIPTETPTDEDLNHPPHIHAIDVQCAKDMMTINIEFNREFNGVIYSKGFYSNPDCRYVQENSRKVKYSFTVSLNSCGTEFVNAFDTQGQSYLENILVLQNEPGIQEVWDTIRSVRCLWEGNLNQALSVALSVGMLTQEIVTFSGDTAMARLDIQLGRGPFAQPANGLVKIGEVMTLVVSVSGDPGFDIQVRDCKAKDSTNTNEVALTDSDGCVLKPKLFGAFQKTRETKNTGASIIAYAFFNAFKFPDVMDLLIECNIELCKTNCQMCPNGDQKIEPGRRRRDVSNETLSDAVTMGKMFHVILPEDIEETSFINLQQPSDSLCMSTHGFVLSSICLICVLVASSVFSAYMWLKNQQLQFRK